MSACHGARVRAGFTLLGQGERQSSTRLECGFRLIVTHLSRRSRSPPGAVFLHVGGFAFARSLAYLSSAQQTERILYGHFVLLWSAREGTLNMPVRFLGASHRSYAFTGYLR